MNRYLRHIAVHFLLGLCVQTAQAADGLEEHPGYLNLERLQGIAGRQPSVEVTLSGPVLKMLLQLPAQFEQDEDAQEAIELLKVIDQILVRVFPIEDEQQEDILAFINDTSEALEEEQWTRIVRVREEEDSNVDIHVKLSDDGENLQGLAIMAVEDDGPESEVVFVNIIGNFNPAYLANIGEKFDIDYLDDVEGQMP
jgi:hypothetical protein